MPSVNRHKQLTSRQRRTLKKPVGE
uniref:Uncharacterized protein n=1 Tax=Anguilla anguilla TaxID=7936 RepID=A0A0E9UKA3_ANGAN